MTSTFTNKLQNHVKDFHEAFNHPVSQSPKPMNLERAINRSIWTGEEIVEFIHASCTNIGEFEQAYNDFMQGLSNAFDKSSKEEFIQDDVERVVAQADALTDTDYFVKGSFVEIGVEAEPVFNIVQEANMSKLFTAEDGTKYAQYRDDGKILKSPDFWTPEDKIKEEIQRQINNSLIK
ncbi:hypothetical protein ACQKNX_07455 [Lysinibacillus sp. NPDC093712]|uniref:hypothetical protein n=1 Tax=Lysinibacillus sp. NPDC093712 TaxID=3390579 RepID=UPI003CFBE9B0